MSWASLLSPVAVLMIVIFKILLWRVVIAAIHLTIAAANMLIQVIATLCVNVTGELFRLAATWASIAAAHAFVWIKSITMLAHSVHTVHAVHGVHDYEQCEQREQ